MANELANRPDFGLTASAPQAYSTQAATAQSREIARTQGEILMAKKFPRDEALALQRVETTCSRMTLAKSAVYEYAKGNAKVTGPSIRLAEQLARCWGNIRYGFEVVEQHETYSVVRTYAYDIEANVLAERVFTVTHEMGLKGGGKKKLTDPRDIYEHIANQASRRVRACILETIPGDVVDYAVDKCKATLKKNVNITPDSLQTLIASFAPYGITQPMIEARIQCDLNAISANKYIEMQQIWTALHDGMGKPEDYFDVSLKEQTATALPSVDLSVAAPKAPKKQTARKAPAPQPEPAPVIEAEPEPIPEEGPETYEDDSAFAGAEDAFMNGDFGF